MTSYDRHASHNSPNRTKRMSFGPGRHAPLTSVSTTAVNTSRSDFDTSYSHESDDVNGGGGGYFSSANAASPRIPYSPGLRTTMGRQSADVSTPLERPTSSGEYQMQSFSDGLPPPPPVEHSWRRIERWAEDYYKELLDNICEGCTQNDLNELEHELDCSLPLEVRESLQIHDGQERGGLPTGLIFGCMLLDCEEIVQEWRNWRKVNEEYLSHQVYEAPQLPVKAFSGASSSASLSPPVPNSNKPVWKIDLLAKQDSHPPNAVQKAYAHPAWIPVARDWGGNNLAIDLAPGPAGKWGQVIIMGRDYDCKYVVARSWAAFLATLADDLCSSKVHIDEETNELKLLEFKKQNVEPPYLEILRWRTDQKYGRRGVPKRPKFGTHRSNSAPSSPLSGSSPYGSPLGDGDARRSPPPPSFLQNRVPSSSTLGSSRVHASSPLARLAESAPMPLRIHTKIDAKLRAEGPKTSPPEKTKDKLVAVNTPGAATFDVNGPEKENIMASEDVTTMKTVEI